MEKLSITRGLGHPSECREYMTEYVDLSEHKNLRLVAFTNSPLDLYLVHSLDGETKGISQRYKLTAGAWRSEKFECQMKFVAIEVINCSDIANSNLVVTVTGQDRRHSNTPPLVTPRDMDKKHVEIVEPEKEERKSKSPFRKFVFKKTTPHGSLPQNDRLPNFIPEGAILIGGKKDKMECLPRGNPFEVLMTGADGFPCFVPLHEMIQIYLGLREKEDMEASLEEVTTIPTGWSEAP